MPIAEPTRPPAKQAALVGLGAIAALATIFLLVVQLGGVGGNQVPITPGSSTFILGDAVELAETVAESGPILLPDASGGSRDVYVQHLGPGPTAGWVTFAVRPLDAPRDCVATWQEADRNFVDSCNGTVYPEDGTGLRQFPTTITEDGNVQIGLGI